MVLFAAIFLWHTTTSMGIASRSTHDRMDHSPTPLAPDRIMVNLHSIVHSFIHAFNHSIIHSFTLKSYSSLVCSFIPLSFIQLFVHSCIHSFNSSFIHFYSSLNCLFVNLFIHRIIQLLIHLHLFLIQLFIHSFIHSFNCSLLTSSFILTYSSF